MFREVWATYASIKTATSQELDEIEFMSDIDRIVDQAMRCLPNSSTDQFQIIIASAISPCSPTASIQASEAVLENPKARGDDRLEAVLNYLGRQFFRNRLWPVAAYFGDL